LRFLKVSAGRDLFGFNADRCWYHAIVAEALTQVSRMIGAVQQGNNDLRPS